MFSFPFFIVVDGLRSMFKSMMLERKFIGMWYKDMCQHISDLQFVDDTLIIGENNWSNIWAIKVAFQLFEVFLVSR